MNKILILLCLISPFTSSLCASPDLYTHEDYGLAVCKYLTSPEDNRSIEKLLYLYEDTIKKQKRGKRKVPAPGIYADYGFLLIKFGEVEKGKEMLQKEMELYPESSVFINNFLKKYNDEKK